MLDLATLAIKVESNADDATRSLQSLAGAGDQAERATDKLNAGSALLAVQNTSGVLTAPEIPSLSLTAPRLEPLTVRPFTLPTFGPPTLDANALRLPEAASLPAFPVSRPGGAPTVNIYNQSGTQLDASVQTSDGKDGERMIQITLHRVAEDIGRDGPISQVMRTKFNLSQALGNRS